MLFSYLTHGLALVLGAALAWVGHGISVEWTEARHADELAALTAACEADKRIIKEASDAFQRSLYGRDSELADAKRLLRDRPTIIIRKPAGQPGSAPALGEHGGGDGVDPELLLDFAGECEGYRLQVSGILDFVER